MTQRTHSGTGPADRPLADDTSRRGLTAVELLILAGLLVLMAMVVLPQMTRGASAERHAELVGRLATLRNAIDLYAAEHRGEFPTAERFEQQLTGEAHTGDDEDDAQGVPDAAPVGGMYLDQIPALPLGRYEGDSSIVDGSIGLPGDRPGGWFYNPDNGRIRANLPDAATDPRGVPYNRY